MAEDKASKKHPASDRKKKEQKKKGNVPKSQDLPMAVTLLGGFAVIIALHSFYMGHMGGVIRACIESIKDTDQIDLGKLMLMVTKEIIVMSLPVLCTVMVLGILAQLGMVGFIFTGEQLKPSLKKINPMTKIKGWFQIKSLVELGKSLAKILVTFVMGALVWKGAIGAIAESMFHDVHGLLALGGTIVAKMFWMIIALYILIAAADFMFQRRNWMNEQKMTDKEVRDEYKQSEGDPYMKQKRRQMAQQISMQTAADEHVPQADAVIINPTELAIALRYDPETCPVPYVVAKGEQVLADRIREAAGRNGVPVVRNKPLARQLYELCEIGDIVPSDLYRPVAEVLSYVFSIKESADPAASSAAQVQPGQAPRIHEATPAATAQAEAAAGAGAPGTAAPVGAIATNHATAPVSPAMAGYATPAVAQGPIAAAPVATAHAWGGPQTVYSNENLLHTGGEAQSPWNTAAPQLTPPASRS